MESLEDRLRRALRETADQVEPSPRWSVVAERAPASRRWRPRRVLVPAFAAAIVLAIIATAIVVARDRPTPADGPRTGGVIGLVPASSEYTPDLSDLSLLTTLELTDPSEVRLQIYLRPEARPAEIEALGSALRADPDVVNVEYCDQDCAYEEFRELFASDPDLVESIEASALPVSYSVTPRASLGDDVRDRYAEAPGVDSILPQTRPAPLAVAEPYAGWYWCEGASQGGGDNCPSIGGVGSAVFERPVGAGVQSFTVTIGLGSSALAQSVGAPTASDAEFCQLGPDADVGVGLGCSATPDPLATIEAVDVNGRPADLVELPDEPPIVIWQPRDGVFAAVRSGGWDLAPLPRRHVPGAREELLDFAADLRETTLVVNSVDDRELPTRIMDLEAPQAPSTVIGSVSNGQACITALPSLVGGCADADTLALPSVGLGDTALGIAPRTAEDVVVTVERNGERDTIRTEVLGADLGLDSGFFAVVLDAGDVAVSVELGP